MEMEPLRADDLDQHRSEISKTYGRLAEHLGLTRLESENLEDLDFGKFYTLFIILGDKNSEIAQSLTALKDGHSNVKDWKKPNPRPEDKNRQGFRTLCRRLFGRPLAAVSRFTREEQKPKIDGLGIHQGILTSDIRSSAGGGATLKEIKSLNSPNGAYGYFVDASGVGPNFRFVLTYDPSSNITTAYITETMYEGAGSTLISDIKTIFARAIGSVHHLASRPMLVPLLLVGQPVRILDDHPKWLTGPVLIVQERLELLEKHFEQYLNHPGADVTKTNIDRLCDLSNTHADLLQINAFLTNTSNIGITSMVKTCSTILKYLLNLKTRRQNYLNQKDREQICSDSHQQLNVYMTDLERTTEHLKNKVDVILSGLWMREKAIYQEVQQIIADESKYNSSKIMVLTILGVLFLPVSAVAQVFSLFNSPGSTDAAKFWLIVTGIIFALIYVGLIHELWSRRLQARRAINIAGGLAEDMRLPQD